jgi:hypothetical protein
MITIAVFVLIVFHPGFGFQDQFSKLQYEKVSTGPVADGSKEAISLGSIEHLRGPGHNVSYA